MVSVFEKNLIGEPKKMLLYHDLYGVLAVKALNLAKALIGTVLRFPTY